jgi:hypothetical protein
MKGNTTNFLGMVVHFPFPQMKAIAYEDGKKKLNTKCHA